MQIHSVHLDLSLATLPFLPQCQWIKYNGDCTKLQVNVLMFLKCKIYFKGFTCHRVSKINGWEKMSKETRLWCMWYTRNNGLTMKRESLLGQTPKLPFQFDKRVTSKNRFQSTLEMHVLINLSSIYEKAFLWSVM